MREKNAIIAFFWDSLQLMKQVSFTGITVLISVADFILMKLNISKMRQIANCCREIGNIYKFILISGHL